MVILGHTIHARRFSVFLTHTFLHHRAENGILEFEEPPKSKRTESFRAARDGVWQPARAPGLQDSLTEPSCGGAR